MMSKCRSDLGIGCETKNRQRRDSDDESPIQRDARIGSWIVEWVSRPHPSCFDSRVVPSQRETEEAEAQGDKDAASSSDEAAFEFDFQGRISSFFSVDNGYATQILGGCVLISVTTLIAVFH